MTEQKCVPYFNGFINGSPAVGPCLKEQCPFWTKAEETFLQIEGCGYALEKRAQIAQVHLNIIAAQEMMMIRRQEEKEDEGEDEREKDHDGKPEKAEVKDGPESE